MKLHIDRIEIDLHGDIAAATAQDAARLLGPALAAALGTVGADALGGASLRVGAQPDAATLAARLAQHLAPQISRAIAQPAAARPADPKRGT
jgi:hypothetical protein